MATTRDKVLSDPRSGAKPLSGSPGPQRPTAPQASPAPPPQDPAPAASGSTGRSGPRGSTGSGGPKGKTGPKGSAGGGTKKGKGGGLGNLLPRKPGDRGPAPEHRNYQSIILAEFIAAELLVAMTPIAVRQNTPGLSPYIPRDMSKLLAIGLVYFLLQLGASTGRGAGRFGAWFGLLVLLTVGMNEAANVAKVLDIFGGGTKSKGKGTGKGGGTPPTLT